MKLLIAVFAYNRASLLKNTVESCLAFGPLGELAIIDDGSDEREAIAYLDELLSRGIRVVTRIRGAGALHGGLYENMNSAVEIAMREGYSHIFFVQDDMQFMWRDPDFEKRVANVFAMRPDAAMVLPIFQKKIVEDTLSERLKPFAEVSAWHLEPYGICDLGIMPLKLFTDTGWRFGNSEGENGRHWAKEGYRLFILSSPTLAWVPWPEVRSGDKTFGKKKKLRRPFLLRPLDADKIIKLKSSGIRHFAFHEDYCIPWGWACFWPYWFTKGRREYFRILKNWISIRKSRYPRLVFDYSK